MGAFSSKIHCFYKPASDAGATSAVGAAAAGCTHRCSRCIPWYEIKQMRLNLVQRAEVGPEVSIEEWR